MIFTRFSRKTQWRSDFFFPIIYIFREITLFFLQDLNSSLFFFTPLFFLLEGCMDQNNTFCLHSSSLSTRTRYSIACGINLSRFV